MRDEYRRIHGHDRQERMIPCDITEYPDRYEIEADLPGFAKDEIEISTKDSTLTIRGAHHEGSERQGRLLRGEREYTPCRRSFTLGEGLDEENIRARFENGVLTLVILRCEKKEDTGRFIEIG